MKSITPNILQGSAPNALSLIRRAGDKRRKKKALRLLRLVTFGRKFLVKETVSLIDNISDRIRSQRLLYKEYIKKGFCEPNSAEIYFNPYTFLPNTISLVSKRKDKVVGTISAIGDSDHKLPADTLFGSELDQMRQMGMNLMEVTCLALNSEIFKKKAYSLGSIKKFTSLTTMFAGLVSHVHSNNSCTHFVILVNPKHKGIYEFLGFTQFANARFYPFVDKPAVPLIISIKALAGEEQGSPLGDFVKKNYPIYKSSTQIEFHTQELNWYLRKASDQFAQMSSSDIDKIRATFPHFNWEDPKDPENKERLVRQNTELHGQRQSTSYLIDSLSSQM